MMFFVVAGNGTTRDLIGNLLTYLTADPALYRAIAQDRARIPAVVEEVLRIDSPVQLLARNCVADITLDGVKVKPGERVLFSIASANRDADKFPDPDRLDLGRTPNHHVAFGVANHRCIGMPAARMEITLLMQEILDRGLRFRLGGPIDRLRSNFMLGIKHLPVEVAAAGRS